MGTGRNMLRFHLKKKSQIGFNRFFFKKLIMDVMPVGLRGVMVAVMMAALMSSLTSVFNSCSVIFTMDIWKRVRKNSTDVELMVVGRVFVVVFVIISKKLSLYII